MRTILLLLSLFLTLSLSGQIRSGVVDSRGVASSPYGLNLVSNGTMTSNITGWAGTGWAYNSTSGGVALHTAGQSGGFAQYSILTVGKTYYIQFDIGGRTASGVTTKAGTTSSGAVTAANGSYAYTIVCGGNTNLIFQPDYGTGTYTFDGWIDNVVCREVL